MKLKYSTTQRCMLMFPSNNTIKPALAALGFISMTLNNELIQSTEQRAVTTIKLGKSDEKTHTVISCDLTVYLTLCFTHTVLFTVVL